MKLLLLAICALAIANASYNQHNIPFTLCPQSPTYFSVVSVSVNYDPTRTPYNTGLTVSGNMNLPLLNGSRYGIWTDQTNELETLSGLPQGPGAVALSSIWANVQTLPEPQYIRVLFLNTTDRTQTCIDLFFTPPSL